MTPQEFVKYYFGDPAKNGFGIPSSIGFQEMVEMLGEYDSHKWISVDERLPEDENGLASITVISTAGGYIFGEDFYIFSKGSWSRAKDIATHWQPLPALPKQ